MAQLASGDCDWSTCQRLDIDLRAASVPVDAELGPNDLFGLVQVYTLGVSGRTVERKCARRTRIRAVAEVAQRCNRDRAHRIGRATDVAGHELVAEAALTPVSITGALATGVLDRYECVRAASHPV